MLTPIKGVKNQAECIKQRDKAADDLLYLLKPPPLVVVMYKLALPEKY